MKFIIVFGLLVSLIGCTTIQKNQIDDSNETLGTMDQFLVKHKLVDSNFNFYKLKDYLTDPLYLREINNVYYDLPKALSNGHSFDSVDFSRNHFYVRHSIDNEKYKGPISMNNRPLLKKILLEQECKGLFASSKAIQKNGGIGITQTYYFVKENYRVVVDMNTSEC